MPLELVLSLVTLVPSSTPPSQPGSLELVGDYCLQQELGAQTVRMTVAAKGVQHHLAGLGEGRAVGIQWDPLTCLDLEQYITREAPPSKHHGSSSPG